VEKGYMVRARSRFSAVLSHGNELNSAAISDACVGKMREVGRIGRSPTGWPLVRTRPKPSKIKDLSGRVN
jgi:hypothetical protein